MQREWKLSELLEREKYVHTQLIVRRVEHQERDLHIRNIRDRIDDTSKIAKYNNGLVLFMAVCMGPVYDQLAA